MTHEIDENYYLNTRQAYVQRFTLIYSSICLTISCYFTPQDFNLKPAIIVNLLLFLIAAPYWLRKTKMSHYTLNVTSQVSNALASIWICSFLGPTSHINMVAIPQFLLVLMMFGKEHKLTRFFLGCMCIFQLLLPLVPFVDEWYKDKRMIESNLIILRSIIDLTILVISIFQFRHIVENWKEIVGVAEREKIKFQFESEWSKKLIKILGHDIKEPMVYALQLIRKVRKEATDDPKRLKQVEAALISMREVISNVESLTSDAKLHQFPRTHLSLQEVLEKLLPWQRIRLEEKSIQVDISETHLEHRLYVMAEPFTYQVFNNLLTNAIKFSPVNSSIKMSTHIDSHDQVVWTIRDYGQGIGPDAFAENSQSSPGTIGEAGSNLGIKIIKMISQKEDLTITWESKRMNPHFEGDGTQITITQRQNS